MAKAVIAVSSAAVVMANIQGAVAPFASLISLLPLGSHDKRLIHTLGQVRQGLAAYPGAGGRTAPALEAMISDFALYHAALAANLGNTMHPAPALLAFFTAGPGGL